jgi:DNA-binding transcriptional ArsR family regulator
MTETRRLSRILQSLCNETRLVVLSTLTSGLAKTGVEVCRDTGLSQSVVSHAMKDFENVELVFITKVGIYSQYSMNKSTLDIVIEALKGLRGDNQLPLPFKKTMVPGGLQ